MKKVLYIIEGYTGYKRIDENIIKSFAQIRTFNYVSKKDYFDINLLVEYNMVRRYHNLVCFKTLFTNTHYK